MFTTVPKHNKGQMNKKKECLPQKPSYKWLHIPDETKKFLDKMDNYEHLYDPSHLPPIIEPN